MSSALMPRVRVLMLCDGIRASRIEENVFTLRGARYLVYADSFPLRRRLQMFLLLSSPRRGRFPGDVQVVEDETDRVVFHAHLDPMPEFREDEEHLPLTMPLNIRFPRAGRYTVRIQFFQETASDIVKMEQPFFVVEQER